MTPLNLNRAVCHDTLAAAYAAAGRFDEGVETAVGLATGNAQKQLAAQIEQRLAASRQRLPLRESVK